MMFRSTAKFPAEEWNSARALQAQNMQALALACRRSMVPTAKGSRYPAPAGTSTKVSGLGYSVSGSAPYFSPDPMATASGSVNGIPTTAISLDSFLQQQVANDVAGAVGLGRLPQDTQPGTTAATIQGLYRTMAERQCQAYAFTCSGSPDSLADTYSSVLFQALKAAPPPQSAKSYSSLYDYLFTGGAAAEAAGQSQLTGQLPAPAAPPVAAAVAAAVQPSPAPSPSPTPVYATPAPAVLAAPALYSTAMPSSTSAAVDTSGSAITAAAPAVDTSGLSLSTGEWVALGVAGLLLAYFAAKGGR